MHCGLFTDLGALIPGAGPQLVDLRFSHIGPLLCIVKLMLEFPVLGHVGVHLIFLRKRKPRKIFNLHQTKRSLSIILIFSVWWRTEKLRNL